MSLISLKDVSFRYSSLNENLALDNVSLTIERGEWITIIGANGSGKSTLVKTLNGLNMPVNGKVMIDDLELSEENIWEIRQKVGIVFQNPDNQFVGSTVADDVAFGLENMGMPRDEMIKRIDESLIQVSMENYKDIEPSRLSGGQKQRVAIAGILALKPEIIIFDEATSMLDPKGRFEVLKVLKEVKEKNNLTVISITHDINEAAEADQIIVMEKGKIKYQDKPKEIFKLGEKLVPLGLTVPFIEELMKKLQENNLEINGKITTEEGLVDWLWKYNLKM
ncbi:MAG: energy-coupling factor ABC transporter ATP-binding protein [Atopostipes suicloacalis]|nr:energy-coupling factor ABC transporter ATP-binding protein [Atopostipes suicloacalis]MDN6731452.1 energy-coupling factor ABC transporter ATP-binding protein [Atopostipes suicloacalis]